MSLERYEEKRDFSRTKEPRGTRQPASSPPATLRYVVQKHAARNLHYDFRLEWNGALLSWAVPKGPSTDPLVKRLATAVEDHPVEYADFEGVIPEGEYGGGAVMVWDRGTWTPEVPDVDAALGRGDLKFTLHGQKLRGSWVLVRTKGFPPGAGEKSWLLIKHRDAAASADDILIASPRSVLSDRTLAQVAEAGGGNVAKAAAADRVRPAPPGGPAATRRARPPHPDRSSGSARAPRARRT
jgi:bifunctional non-homologous end joining protein LigD